MAFSETILTALSALKANKVRSFLTMLGIIIGVFAVLSLVSLVQGVKNYIVDQFSVIGSDIVLVEPGRFNLMGDPSIARTNNKLNEKDVDDINKSASDYIVTAAPNIRLNKTVAYKSNNYYAEIRGANHKFLTISNFEINEGRSIEKYDVSSAARVAVIGPEVAKRLSLINPINKHIKISDIDFKVIGTTVPRGSSLDNRIIIPYTTIMKSLKVKNISGITIKVKQEKNISEVMNEVELILLNNHKKDEFSVLTAKDILKAFQNILKTLSIGLGAIAGISLLVGGIGIMNIMLVSVNERIGEIGLRKALGATSKNIATQFLLESLFLSVTGGLVGIILGLLATLTAQPYLRAETPLWAVLVSFGFSLLVGIVFGTYPAISASKKDPVESLRYEL